MSFTPHHCLFPEFAHKQSVQPAADLRRAVGEIDIVVAFHDGGACATAWGCDLTYDYVKINGDYRT